MCFTCPLFYAQNIEKNRQNVSKKTYRCFKKNIGRF